VLEPGPAEALAGVLDVPVPDEALPLMWHGVYLLERPRQSDVGPDGHPVRHSVPTPPAHGLRRMFAGGRTTVHRPLRVGEPATRRTRVTATATREGRTGRLTFVTVAHEYEQNDALAVLDEQDLVYRAKRSPSADPPVAEEPAEALPLGTGERAVPIDPTLLFRFSALTYNAHRIHYDRTFATLAEGYPGLLVHGPLQSLLMAEQARAAGLPIGPVRFEYRLESPLFDAQGCVVGAAGGRGGFRTHVRDTTGRRTATGSVVPGA